VSTRSTRARAAEHRKHHGDDRASAEGGDTRATSGDAYGGDGGNADADGGKAVAVNKAGVFQSNWSGFESLPW
jgi:hypothetical protein